MMSETGEASGDGREGGSSMQIVVDGPWSNGLPPLGYCHMCSLFLVHSSYCFLLIALH